MQTRNRSGVAGVRRVHLERTVFLAGTMALFACAFGQKAEASLIWNITASPIIANWNASNPGDELRISYLIQNQSSPGDANNLIQFSVSAGLDHGVYNASTPGGNWTASILQDQTIFSGNGSYIAPNSSDTFRIFSYNTQPATGTANAIASFPEGTPFPSQSVPIPVIPEPMTLALFALGGGAAWRKRCGGACV